MESNEGVDKETESYYKMLFDGNKAFINEMISKDENFFLNMASSQYPKALIIGCVDSRVHPATITQTKPGELFIHRNIANQIHSTDLNCLSAIQYAVEYLKVKHIIVLGHTNCGGIKASMSHHQHGMIDLWLNIIKDIQLLHRDELDACKTEEEKLDLLTYLNVKENVINVMKLPFVQKALKNKQELHINGWMYKINEGKIIDLHVKSKYWERVKKYYEFDD